MVRRRAQKCELQAPSVTFNHISDASMRRPLPHAIVRLRRQRQGRRLGWLLPLLPPLLLPRVTLVLADGLRNCCNIRTVFNHQGAAYRSAGGTMFWHAVLACRSFTLKM